MLCLTHKVNLSECRPFHKINLKNVIWFFNFSYTGSRKGGWQNQAKAHPVDQRQNSAVTQRGPPPRPGSGPRFAPQAVGRPFKDHFTSGAQQFGIRPMAPPGGGPAGRFSLRGPPFDGPLEMVPPHSHTGSTIGFTLRHCLPLQQGFSEPLSGGPCFQGPWQVSAPSGFSSQHPMPQGFPEPSFQGRNYIGMHPPPLSLIICDRSAVEIHYVKINVLFGVLHWFIKVASLLHMHVQLGQESRALC